MENGFLAGCHFSLVVTPLTKGLKSAGYGSLVASSFSFEDTPFVNDSGLA